MSNTAYDVIVIGAGPGGYVLALDCARRGLRTALVEEREELGGTCLNVGCIPSKALLESSELYYKITKEAAQNGIKVSDVSLNLSAMMKRKETVVKTLTSGIALLLKSRKVDVVHGRGVVDAPGQVRVSKHSKGGNSRTLKAPRIVLVTGSLPAALPKVPFDGEKIVDSTDAISFSRVPRKLAIVGAGAVGLELASVWNRLGAKVTVVEALDSIIPAADSQAGRVLAAALTKQGIEIQTGVSLQDVQTHSKGVRLVLRKPNQKEAAETLSVNKVLIAIGRRANFESALGKKVSPARTSDGRFLQVNEQYATSVEGLYAIGDVTGNPMLAHKAEDEALALASIFAGEGHPPWGGPIPGIVYTEPELAWAGESEESLKAAGTPYKKGYFPFAANGRALAANAQEGFVKLLSGKDDARLLGAVIVGRNASELIAEAVSVMAMGGSAEDIALTIHGHPTLSETVREAALEIAGRPLHRG